MINPGQFHRRELKAPCIAFSSAEGRLLFKDSLEHGTMETYFPLAEQFTTQGHPAFCGLGSLTMALNAILLDPARPWQGSVWRWFDESMLDCCEPHDVIKIQGITMAKLSCLASCNGASVQIRYASDVTLEEFRAELARVCKQEPFTSLPDSARTVMVASYARPVLSQSGSGHFSPIGGYNEHSDMLLIMDVARFKYPPHWCPVSVFFQAMQQLDPDSGRSRGYLLISPNPSTTDKHNGGTQRGTGCCQAGTHDAEETALGTNDSSLPGVPSCDEIIAEIEHQSKKFGLPSTGVDSMRNSFSSSHSSSIGGSSKGTAASIGERIQSLVSHSCAFCSSAGSSATATQTTRTSCTGPGVDLDSEALQSLIPVSYHPGYYCAFPSGLNCWPCCVGRDVEAIGCKFGQVKHHPGTFPTDYSAELPSLVRSSRLDVWTCCGNPERGVDGCTLGPHPRSTAP